MSYKVHIQRNSWREVREAKPPRESREVWGAARPPNGVIPILGLGVDGVFDLMFFLTSLISGRGYINGDQLVFVLCPVASQEGERARQTGGWACVRKDGRTGGRRTGTRKSGRPGWHANGGLRGARAGGRFVLALNRLNVIAVTTILVSHVGVIGHHVPRHEGPCYMAVRAMRRKVCGAPSHPMVSSQFWDHPPDGARLLKRIPIAS